MPERFGGVFWHNWGWMGVSAFVAVMLIGGLFLANNLRKIPVLGEKSSLTGGRSSGSAPARLP